MDASDVAACWEANAETWTRHARAGYDLYRDAQNTPVFLANLPPVAGLNGLDIGCGEGGNTRKLAERGGRMTAIDIAPTFIRHAREAEAAAPLGIEPLVTGAFARDLHLLYGRGIAPRRETVDLDLALGCPIGTRSRRFGQACSPRAISARFPVRPGTGFGFAECCPSTSCPSDPWSRRNEPSLGRPAAASSWTSSDTARRSPPHDRARRRARAAGRGCRDRRAAGRR